MDAANPVVVDVDRPTAAEAVRLAAVLAPHVGGFRVGIGLICGAGPGVVGALARIGPVLADVKLHDLPSQVAAAAARLGEYGARWVTVHASGGAAMVAAAVAGLARSSGGAGGVLAETVLTGVDASRLTEIGFSGGPGRTVSRLARIAAGAGAEGVVCGIRHLGDVAQVAPGLIRATAGIRPDGPLPGDEPHDVAVPEEALRRGSTILLVGRPIVAAPDPVAAAAALAARVA